MHIRIQNSRILFQQLQVHSSNVSLNRIKIQEILLIRNRLLLQVIHFRNAFEAVTLQSSQRLPELLFYTKKSYKILQLQFQLQFQLQCYTCTLHYNPENSPSRIQFYMQKTKSSSSTTTTYRGQRTFIPEKKFYAWKARRSSRNPSVCLTRHPRQLQLLQRHSRHSSHS